MKQISSMFFKLFKDKEKLPKFSTKTSQEKPKPDKEHTRNCKLIL